MVYTEGPYVVVHVIARVTDPRTADPHVTNTFDFTFYVPERQVPALASPPSHGAPSRALAPSRLGYVSFWFKFIGCLCLTAQVPPVLPESYSEGIMYLNGRRKLRKALAAEAKQWQPHIHS